MLGAFKGAAPPGQPRRVAYFVHEGFQLLDLAGPNAVFSVVNGLLGADHYDTQLCAAKAGMVSTEAGIRMAVSGPSAIVPELDTLLVVGGPRAHRLALDEPIRARFHRAAAAHVRVGSVCTGAFILGAAGLLDERACTTHWAYAAELHQRYPQARVMAEQSFDPTSEAATQSFVGPATVGAHGESGGDLEGRFEDLLEAKGELYSLGRYLVRGRLGRGGMSTVLRAFDPKLDRRVAIKVLHEELGEHQTQRLLREAQALAKLSHPNVCRSTRSTSSRGGPSWPWSGSRGRPCRAGQGASRDRAGGSVSRSSSSWAKA